MNTKQKTGLASASEASQNKAHPHDSTGRAVPNPQANRLRELREAQGLSLVELAAKAGTTNQQISHLELGKRQLTVGWLVRLAQALNCHPWAIVSAADPSTSEEVQLLATFRTLPAERQRSLLSELRSIPKPVRSADLQNT